MVNIRFQPNEDVQIGDIYKVKITEILPQASFKVLLDNGHTVQAVISGRLRKNRIRILTGDRVRVAISPYDLRRGRVIFRL